MSVSLDQFLNAFDPARNGLADSIAETKKQTEATDAYTRNYLNQQNQKVNSDLAKSPEVIKGLVKDGMNTVSDLTGDIFKKSIGNISDAFGLSPQMLLVVACVVGYVLIKK